jgi:hypothetical protein
VISPIDKTKLDASNQSSLLVDASQKNCVGLEADVAALVRMALSDTLKLLSINHNLELTVRMERSLFSCRPDILVVSTAMHDLPLFAIEVKKYKERDLFNVGKVLGQVFDYAEILAAFGHKLPFVVLSSFEQSFVCWLQDETATELTGYPLTRYKAADANSSSTPDNCFAAFVERRTYIFPQ